MASSLTSTPLSVGFHISRPSQKTQKTPHLKTSLDHNIHTQNGSKALLREEPVGKKGKWKIWMWSPPLEEAAAQYAVIKA